MKSGTPRLDNGEQLPPKELGLTALAAAAYCYLIASADQSRALDFAHLTSMRGKQIIASAGAAEWASVEAGHLDDAMLQIEYLTERQVEAVESVLRLVYPRERAATRAALRPLPRELRRMGKEEAAALAGAPESPGTCPPRRPATRAWTRSVPRRLTMGP